MAHLNDRRVRYGKDKENLRKHGVSLIIGRAVLENMINEKLDLYSSGEERWIAYGPASGKLMVCVYTMRGGAHRIISVRPATKQEAQECRP